MHSPIGAHATEQRADKGTSAHRAHNPAYPTHQQQAHSQYHQQTIPPPPTVSALSPAKSTSKSSQNRRFTPTMTLPPALSTMKDEGKVNVTEASKGDALTDKTNQQSLALLESANANLNTKSLIKYASDVVHDKNDMALNPMFPNTADTRIPAQSRSRLYGHFEAEEDDAKPKNTLESVFGLGAHTENDSFYHYQRPGHIQTGGHMLHDLGSSEQFRGSKFNSTNTRAYSLPGSAQSTGSPDALPPYKQEFNSRVPTLYTPTHMMLEREKDVSQAFRFMSDPNGFVISPELSGGIDVSSLTNVESDIGQIDVINNQSPSRTKVQEDALERSKPLFTSLSSDKDGNFKHVAIIPSSSSSKPKDAVQVTKPIAVRQRGASPSALLRIPEGLRNYDISGAINRFRNASADIDKMSSIHKQSNLPPQSQAQAIDQYIDQKQLLEERKAKGNSLPSPSQLLSSSALKDAQVEQVELHQQLVKQKARIANFPEGSIHVEADKVKDGDQIPRKDSFYLEQFSDDARTRPQLGFYDDHNNDDDFDSDALLEMYRRKRKEGQVSTHHHSTKASEGIFVNSHSGDDRALKIDITQKGQDVFDSSHPLVRVEASNKKSPEVSRANFVCQQFSVKDLDLTPEAFELLEQMRSSVKLPSQTTNDEQTEMATTSLELNEASHAAKNGNDHTALRPPAPAPTARGQSPVSFVVSASAAGSQSGEMSSTNNSPAFVSCKVAVAWPPALSRGERDSETTFTEPSLPPLPPTPPVLRVNSFSSVKTENDIDKSILTIQTIDLNPVTIGEDSFTNQSQLMNAKQPGVIYKEKVTPPLQLLQSQRDIVNEPAITNNDIAVRKANEETSTVKSQQVQGIGQEKEIVQEEAKRGSLSHQLRELVSEKSEEELMSLLETLRRIEDAKRTEKM